MTIFQTIKDMLLGGYSQVQIADALKMEPSSINYHARKLYESGIKSRFSVEKWPQERVDQLLKLISEGYSAGVIGQQLGLTRNAVIGKAHRLGLVVGGSKEPGKTKKRVARPRVPSQKPQRFRTVDAWQAALRAADVVPLHLSLFDIERGQCRYPFGDGPFTFCGCKTLEGSSYCDPHHQLSHTTVTVSAPTNRRDFYNKMRAA